MLTVHLRGATVSVARIPILRVGNTMLVTLQGEIGDVQAEAMQQDLLEGIERTAARGLVIDISGLDMVDSYVARTLVDTGRMARLMGAATVLVGMRPEVAATLVRMGYAMEGVDTALNVDEGLALLGSRRA
jgi:rsbT antagonist protein RsbS